MFTIPLWLAIVETLTFVSAIAVVVYNRAVSWRRYNERVTRLETLFEQYQKDIGQYFETCKGCRLEVSRHHESNDRHVTPDMRQQISRMAAAIDEIKSYLITKK